MVVGTVAALGYYYQDRILQHFVQEANRYLTAPVEVANISLSFLNTFPRVSVALDEVQIAGHTDGLPLAQLAQANFSFDLYALLQGQYVIDRADLRHGEVYLHVDQASKRNFDIFRPVDTIRTTASRPPLTFHLQTVVLDQVQVDYVDDPLQHHTDLQVQQAVATLAVQGSQYDIQIEGDLLCDGIRVEEQSYFAQKPLGVDARLTYQHREQHLQIKPSTLAIGQGTFNVSGTVDHTDGTQLDLAVDGQDTDVQTLLSLLPTEMVKPLSAYRSQGEVYLKGTVQGAMPAPRVDVKFGCQNASIYHPTYQRQLDQLQLSGSFTNGDQQSLETAELSLQDIRGTLEGEAIAGNLLIRNFRDYYLDLQLQTDISAQSVLDFYPLADVRSVSGRIKADVRLAGKLKDMRSAQLAHRQRTQSSGSVSVRDFHLHLTQYPLPFRRLAGTFDFRNNDVAISDFDGYVGHSHFQLNGFFRNAIAYALSDTHPIEIEANLYSSLVDLDELLSGQLNDLSTTNNAAQKDWETTTDKQPYRFYLDPRLSLDFNCRVDRVKFRRFKGRQLHSRLNIDNQIARVRNLSVAAAGGTASASGTIYAQRPQRINVRVDSHFEGIQADSLFYVFEDFQQDFLTAQHLRGGIYADVDWLMNFDRTLQLDYPSLLVTADTKIVDGQLNDFEPMQSLSQFVEDKNLSRLRFGQLQGRIRIADQQIHIPPLNVYNNVSDITVQGVHTFDHQLDYQIAMPMKGIHLRSDQARQRKQQRKKYFGEVADDNAKPMNLFLTAKGSIDDYKIAYDFEKAKLALKQNLKEEKQERRTIFKNKGRRADRQVELEDEYFDFDQ